MKTPLFSGDKKSDKEDLRRVDYKKISEDAQNTRVIVRPNKYAVVLIDFQIDFMNNCEEALRNACNFLYYNIEKISDLYVFMQGNSFCKINFQSFWNDKYGRPVTPGTIITEDKVNDGLFCISQNVRDSIPQFKDGALDELVMFALQRYRKVEIEKYIAMLGSIGSSLIPEIEESIFFHYCLSGSQPVIDYSGNHPLSNDQCVFYSELERSPSGANLCGSKKYYIDSFRKYEKILFMGGSRNKVIISANEVASPHNGMKRKVIILEDCCGKNKKDKTEKIKNVVLDENNFVNTSNLPRGKPCGFLCLNFITKRGRIGIERMGRY